MTATTSQVAAACRDLTAAREHLDAMPGHAAALNVQAAKRILATAVNEVRSGFRIV